MYMYAHKPLGYKIIIFWIVQNSWSWLHQVVGDQDPSIPHGQSITSWWSLTFSHKITAISLWHKTICFLTWYTTMKSVKEGKHNLNEEHFHYLVLSLSKHTLYILILTGNKQFFWQCPIFQESSRSQCKIQGLSSKGQFCDFPCSGCSNHESWRWNTCTYSNP